jgi:hypothetical protein
MSIHSEYFFRFVWTFSRLFLDFNVGNLSTCILTLLCFIHKLNSSCLQTVITMASASTPRPESVVGNNWIRPGRFRRLITFNVVYITSCEHEASLENSHELGDTSVLNVIMIIWWYFDVHVMASRTKDTSMGFKTLFTVTMVTIDWKEQNKVQFTNNANMNTTTKYNHILNHHHNAHTIF